MTLWRSISLPHKSMQSICLQKFKNEFVNLCGTQTSNSITERRRSAQYFPVMEDASADMSNIEQFAFCVRFTEKSGSDIHTVPEEFLAFVSTQRENMT